MWTSVTRGNIFAAGDSSTDGWGVDYVPDTGDSDRCGAKGFNYNVFQANAAGAYRPGFFIEQNESNLYLQPSEPLFVDAAALDFRLKCESEARGLLPGGYRDPGAIQTRPEDCICPPLRIIRR
jgi:hypothetical protein